MCMPKPVCKFVVQHLTDGGEWIDIEDHPVKLRAEKIFEDYKRRIPKHYSVRLLKRVEEVLSIRQSSPKQCH